MRSVPNTAASYARISEKDEKRDKVADQHAQNRELATRRGYVIVAEYTDDGISALGGKERPDFRRMMDDAARGAFSVILATEEERLARNVPEKIELHGACEVAGVVWETDRDGYVDPSTDSGEFMSTIRAAMGRIESKRKARRQIDANRARAERGEPNPGRRRYGYEVDGRTPRDQARVPWRTSEAAVVRRIFTHIAEGGSLRSLTNQLRKEGAPVGTFREWNQRRVRDLALNPHYAGSMRHRGAVIPSSVITPIVDAGLAEEVRAILADERRTTTTGPKPKHLISGLAACGRCGGRMVYVRGYVCAESPTKGHAMLSASHAQALERRVVDEVAAAVVLAGDRLTPVDNRRAMATLLAKRDRIKAAQLETAELSSEGLLDADVVRMRLRTLRDELAEVDANLDRERAAVAELAPLAEVARTLTADQDGAVAMSDFIAARRVVAERFLELHIERQRDAVRAFVDVQVNPYYKHTADGRKVRSSVPRFVVWHKIATELNPEIEVDPDEGNSPGPNPGRARRSPRGMGGA